MRDRTEVMESPEFSRVLPLEALGEEELVREIEATAEERRGLAARLGLVALDRLAAVLRVRRTRNREVIAVGGHFEAEVTQSCVVTLAPVSASLAEDFTVLYGPPASAEPAVVDVDPEAEDPPEPIGEEGLDLGEAVVQQLAVSLDPYPRAPGARLERSSWGPGGEEEGRASSPFQVLKTLTGKR